MNIEKKFFRVKLAEKCSVNTKMVNGVALTKHWQVKVGAIGDFSKFPDVEAQTVVKQGNGFVPSVEASGRANDKAVGSSDNTRVTAQPGGGQAVDTGILAEGSTDAPDFTNMTVEQLKSFLIAKGIAHSELRNVSKPDLIERAEFIWSQST